MLRSLVGSEMCIRDRYQRRVREDVIGTMAGLTPLQSQALNAPVMPSEDLLSTFRALDSKGEGTIDADEFMRALQIFGGNDSFTAEEEKALRTEMGLPAKGGEFDYNMFVQLRDCLANRKLK
eukprot:TRINITY_DN2948_c0_g1_i1.p1 TRINITY_DN2948_c0_g1~~TRINITY_DN2948_c0_g1_i1.p1  ORF type:complete len:137 (-),score=68.17 TRINITY_DN2948_c0_g1_i1:273-638(-)